ncbi:unnamed protein product [Jaminaea pallidilutea]
MSATDQFPPAHLIEEDTSQGEQTDEQKQGASGADQSQEPADSNQRLALPAKPANEDHPRQLDVASGGRVALDELGPMVVNKDGTLSRIHNWSSMTEGEKARTLRVLGARNQLRMADIRGADEDESGDTGEGKEKS